MGKRRRQSLPQTPFDTTISGLTHDGRGIGEVDGKKVFVFGALQDESVSFFYTKKKGRYDEGRVDKVQEASHARVDPVCPHFGLCGGCALQHMSPNFQIEHKQHVLLENLKHIGKVTPEMVAPPLMGATEGYRHKARLGVRYVRKKEALLVGFREQNSNKLAILNECHTLHPIVGKQLMGLRECIADLTCYEKIPQIEVALGDNEKAIIVRHLEPLPEEDLLRLTAFCQNAGLTLYLQPGNEMSVHKVWPKDEVLLHYQIASEGLKFSFHPSVFTQVNPPMNEKMVQQAMSWLGVTKNERVLDLFCGLGNFSLPLAKRAKTVVGVEGAESLVQLATQNAKDNQLDNVSFFAADLEKGWQEKPWAQQSYDKILLDPSRAGAQSVSENISQFGASKILYVSCHPASLARDAHYFVHQHHYTCTRAGVIDMFPHTQHVESMLLFER